MERNKRTIKLIKLYQKNKRISGCCHFIPSCSNYAIGCYQKFNWFYASFLTGCRILRCTPFTKRRVDPVPLTKEEKKQLKLLNQLKETTDSMFVDLIINHSFKYPKMESIDYVILTLEYLFGYSLNSNTSSIAYEYIGKIFIRSNFPNKNKSEIDFSILDNYLSILESLGQNKFVNYTKCFFDISKIAHSQTYIENYPSNYYVTNINTLPLSFFKKEIEKYFIDNSIIGFESVDSDTLKYFKEEWNAEVIDVLDFKKHPNNPVTIIIGDNLSNPLVSYHFNCIVKFYNQNDVFDINKYNIIIPK